MALTKVSTDGVKDDAITKTKIPANQIEASELADNAVDTNAIADQAVALSKLPHGTSSNDGKFLRANNGADPTFETVTGTTINNNADNRLITGSGSANTLNGETNATFTGTKLNLGAYDGGTDVNLSLRNTNSGGFGAYISGGSGTNYILRLDDKDQNAMFRFNANGKLGIGTGTPIGQLHLNQSSNDPYIYIQRGSGDTTATIGGIFWRNSTNNLGLIDVQSADIDAGRMRFYVNKNGSLTESLKIDENGNLEVLDASEARLQVKTPSNGIIALRADGVNTQLGTWSNHDLKLVRNTTEIASITANGITFGGDTAAANALDDYEEGTFTATMGSSGGGASFNSGSTTTGLYTKIGGLVHVTMYFGCNIASAGSGVALISGLPFASNSFTYYPLTITHSTLTVGTLQNGYVQYGNTIFYPIVQNGTGGSALNAGNPRYIMIAGCYPVW